MAANTVKYAITVVAPPGYPHSGAFVEVAKGLVAGLRALGYDAIVTTQGRIPGRRHIVLGANLLPLYPLPLAADTILYNLEQIQVGSSWVKPELIALYKKYTVWDYSVRNVGPLRELGVEVERVVPIGYEPELTRIPKAPVQDIDVLFIGSMNDRRKQIIDAFTAAGVRCSAFFGVYGDTRDALYARARLVLNVHFYEAKVLEIVRLSYLLANRIPVLSERGADPSEDAALSDGVAFADYDQLLVTGLRLLNTPGACEALGARGFDIMSRRRQSDYLRSALQYVAPTAVSSTA